jgi:hypothetical protein
VISRRRLGCVLLVAVVLVTAMEPAWGTPTKPRSDDGVSASPPSPPRKSVSVIPVAVDGLTRALESGRVSEAQYSLQRAASLFALQGVRARFGRVLRSDPHLATLVLRDLAIRIHQLSGAERKRALAILARPDAGIGADPDGYSVPSEVTCSTNVCLHWVESSLDAPPLDDVDLSGFPDWVETTAGVLEDVWQKEVAQYGYRPPKSDLTSASHGPDGRLDVYLADIGDDGLFGYCTTDDPDLLDGIYPPYDGSAYCVLDNDFSAAQFGTRSSGLIGLRVTAAHEFFHASQFSYDALEDLWFMESTAVWMEDEVFDSINDNRVYLRSSSMAQADVPIDYGRRFFLYGNWIFIRFLTEYFGSRAAGDPSVVRDAWELADGSQGGPDYYSMQALAQIARERDSDLSWAFADFGAFNLAPKRFYDEGSAYPTPGIDESFGMTAAKSDTGWSTVRTDHMTNRYVRFRPGRGIGSTAKLALSIDAPPARTGPQATAVVFFKSGAVRFAPFRLNAHGDGVRTVPFRRGSVRDVVLVLTNASTRFKCWLGSFFSCQGRPRDDNQRYFFRAVVT